MRLNYKKNKFNILFLTAIVIVLAATIVLAIALKPASYEEITADKDQEIIDILTAQVSITANGFEPAALKIKPGTKVTWRNNDAGTHQVAANPHPTHGDLPGLVSPILNKDEPYEFTFDQAGSYSYHDELNPTINATIEVQN